MTRFLSIIILLCARTAFAQFQFEPKPLIEPAGANLRKVVVSGKNVIALSNDHSEYYKYIGGSWSRYKVDSSLLMINDVAALPSGEVVALMMKTSGVSELWSLRAGDTKFSFLCTLSVEGSIVTNSSGAILMLSTEPTISYDRGKTWTSAGTSPSFPLGAAAMNDEFAVITTDSVYVVSPTTKEWRNLEYPIPFAKLRSVFYADDTLYVGSELGLQAPRSLLRPGRIRGPLDHKAWSRIDRCHNRLYLCL